MANDSFKPEYTAKVVHFLYEPGDGGLDRVAILLANEMAELGCDCELWMARADGPVAHLISDKVRVRIITAPGVAGRGLHLALQIPALARQIARTKPAVLFSAGNQSNLTIALARLLAGQGSTAIVQKITNPIERPGMGRVRSFFRWLRFGVTARLADLVLTLSEADSQSLSGLYPKLTTRFVAVKNAYVTPAMLTTGEERMEREPPAWPQLLAVGRISVQKDYETLIRALSRIAHCPWTLTILGDGPLMQPTRVLAHQLGVRERIHFKGFVADPTPYYADANILVLASRWEGFPAVPLEAMAAGCDVVATDCSPGLTKILTQLDREPVPIGDPAALACAIEEAIIRSSRTPALRELAADYSITMSAQDHLRIVTPFLI